MTETMGKTWKDQGRAGLEPSAGANTAPIATLYVTVHGAHVAADVLDGTVSADDLNAVDRMCLRHTIAKLREAQEAVA